MDFSMKDEKGKGEFNRVYREICTALLAAPSVGDTKEILNASFTIKDLDSVFSTIRNPSLKYMCAELIWYLTGSRSVDFIGQYASLWKRISDDGKTNNSGYGYLIRTKYGFNQMDKVIELLKKDPSSRRAVINLNYANSKVIETKDEPCTIALQFLVRNGKLNCTAIMRSNDVWWGLPYDIVYFTTLQKLIADALDLDYGTYTHFATSLHAYTRDLKKIENLLYGATVKQFRIDHRKLNHNAKLLYKIATPETLVDICRSAGILIEK